MPDAVYYELVSFIFRSASFPIVPFVIPKRSASNVTDSSGG